MEKKRKAIGIIDDYKRKDRDPFYKEFKVVAEKQNYKHLRHKNGIHELIVTKGKGFEKFITLCAEEKEVKHKLLNDFERLKQLYRNRIGLRKYSSQVSQRTKRKKEKQPRAHRVIMLHFSVFSLYYLSLCVLCDTCIFRNAILV